MSNVATLIFTIIAQLSCSTEPMPYHPVHTTGPARVRQREAPRQSTA